MFRLHRTHHAPAREHAGDGNEREQVDYWSDDLADRIDDIPETVVAERHQGMTPGVPGEGESDPDGVMLTTPQPCKLEFSPPVFVVAGERDRDPDVRGNGLLVLLRQACRLRCYEAFFWRGARLGDCRTRPSGFWCSC